jgi:hypothetical protein
MMSSHAAILVAHMIAVYKERADESDIILSAKRAAKILGVGSHHTAMKTLKWLVESKVIKATYEGTIERPNKCSRWRLNMFPYRGEPAGHEYLTARERRGIRRNRKPREMTIRTTEDVLMAVGLLSIATAPVAIVAPLHELPRPMTSTERSRKRREALKSLGSSSFLPTQHSCNGDATGCNG